MRSATGTKSGEPSFVTLATKATMAFFGAVSFHEGSGSWAWVVVRPARVIASKANALQLGFIWLGLMVRFAGEFAGRLVGDRPSGARSKAAVYWPALQGFKSSALSCARAVP